MKKLILPLAFTELFTDLIICDSLKEAQQGKSGYISVMMDHKNKQGHTHFLVKPSKILIETMNNISIYGFYDMEENKYKKPFNHDHYLKFVQRDDLTTLIIMEYQHIIGSSWINILEKSGMPEYLQPLEHKNHCLDGEHFTNVFHINHNGGLDNLVNLLGKYKLSVDFTSKNEDTGVYNFGGNFEAFSCGFSFKTNDPVLIEKVLTAIKDCKNTEQLSRFSELTNK